MKKATITLISFFIVLTINNTLKAQSTDTEQFQWLIGNWKGKYNDGVFYESWTKANDSTFVGAAYNVVKSDTLFKERLQIQKVNKFWVYIATIEDSYPVLFTLINSDDVKWIFANYEHDFPQRIVYTQKEDGKLHAKLEGDLEGVQVKEEYLLEKQ